MERLLGVKAIHPDELGDSGKADVRDEEAAQRARTRYQRLFWEPVAEDDVSFNPYSSSSRSPVHVLRRLRSRSSPVHWRQQRRRRGRHMCPPSKRNPERCSFVRQLSGQLCPVSLSRRSISLRNQRIRRGRSQSSWMWVESLLTCKSTRDGSKHPQERRNASGKLNLLKLAAYAVLPFLGFLGPGLFVRRSASYTFIHMLHTTLSIYQIFSIQPILFERQIQVRRATIALRHRLMNQNKNTTQENHASPSH